MGSLLIVRSAVACLVAGTLVLAGGAPAASAEPTTWNFAQARIPGAQAAGHNGAGVTVAVVDTWVDSSHPKLRGRVLRGADCVGGRCRTGPSDTDPCGHGTHVAGTVASASYGVAPGARIMPVRVLRYDPSSGGCVGSERDAAAGVRWAAAHGADVINLSLGDIVPGLAVAPGAVRDAARAGAVVVIAAGNSSVPITANYGENALLVAATGPDGGLAGYSQRGGSVDVAAPGGDSGLGPCDEGNCIISTWPGRRHRLLQGTSMAAPHVSGIAALLLAQDPQRERGDVIRTIQSTARPLPGAGNGLVDATAALSARTGAQRRPARDPGSAEESTSGGAARHPRTGAGAASEGSRQADVPADPTQQQRTHPPSTSPAAGSGNTDTEDRDPTASGPGARNLPAGLPLAIAGLVVVLGLVLLTAWHRE